jgi:hypothetical protein
MGVWKGHPGARRRGTRLRQKRHSEVASGFQMTLKALFCNNSTGFAYSLGCKIHRKEPNPTNR